MDKNIRPIGDRIVLSPIKEEQKGAFVNTGRSKVKPSKGLVVAVGPGIYARDSGQFIPTVVKVGDIVSYGVNGVTDFVVDKDEYVIMREMDAFAIMPK